VGLRGPGETQLEVDRREIRQRIATLKDELDKVRAHRSRYRSQRKRAAIPTVALVGYTNAGKSTLLNRLAQTDAYVADELFATLDPTTRRVEIPDSQHVLVTDTVGFIQKLPTALIAAFRATLEEILDADLLVHVVDITHENAVAQAEAVLDTLLEIGAEEINIVTALNKIDRLASAEEAQAKIDLFDRAVPISALSGEGIPTLLNVLDHELFEAMVEMSVSLPYKHGRLISVYHDLGKVDRIDYDQDRILIKGRLPKRLVPEFSPYQVSPIHSPSNADNSQGMSDDAF
jgi:GTP-binding protein HflX